MLSGRVAVYCVLWYLGRLGLRYDGCFRVVGEIRLTWLNAVAVWYVIGRLVLLAAVGWLLACGVGLFA